VQRAEAGGHCKKKHKTMPELLGLLVISDHKFHDEISPLMLLLMKKNSHELDPSGSELLTSL
jgi:hypothetical protein